MRTLEQALDTLPQGGQWYLHKTTNKEDEKRFRCSWEETYSGRKTQLDGYGQTPLAAVEAVLKELGR